MGPHRPSLEGFGEPDWVAGLEDDFGLEDDVGRDDIDPFTVSNTTTVVYVDVEKTVKVVVKITVARGPRLGMIHQSR